MTECLGLQKLQYPGKRGFKSYLKFDESLEMFHKLKGM